MTNRRRVGEARERRKRSRAISKAMKRRCHCGKVRSSSRHEAEQKYLLLNQHNVRWDEVRFYACRFGRWHWTRQPERARAADRDTSHDTAVPEQVAEVDEQSLEPADGTPVDVTPPSAA